MQTYKFFFHYNKPQSKLKKRPQISVHYRGKCMIVDTLRCLVPTYGRISKRQPFFSMAGLAEKIVIDQENAAVIL